MDLPITPLSVFQISPLPRLQLNLLTIPSIQQAVLGLVAPKSKYSKISCQRYLYSVLILMDFKYYFFNSLLSTICVHLFYFYIYISSAIIQTYS